MIGLSPAAAVKVESDEWALTNAVKLEAITDWKQRDQDLAIF